MSLFLVYNINCKSSSCEKCYKFHKNNKSYYVLCEINVKKRHKIIYIRKFSRNLKDLISNIYIMKTSFSVALKYGIFIAVTLIAYFLFVRLFNLHENIWLRLFNGLIMASGIYYGIKYYKLSVSDSFTYIDGFKTGLITGFVGTVLFTAFMAIYMFHIDPKFTETLLGEWFSNYGEGTGILVFIILIEGLASTVVLTLTFMQLLKKSYNISQKA